MNRKEFAKLAIMASAMLPASTGINKLNQHSPLFGKGLPGVARGSVTQKVKRRSYQFLPFGERGQLKMLYDRRQRPQSVYLNHKVYIVFNAGAEEGAMAPSKSKTQIITYDSESGKFSDIVTLTKGAGNDDHHYCPVIWADNNNHIGVLFGGEGRRAGVHLISKKPLNIGTGLDDWDVGAQISPHVCVRCISYPSFYRISDNRQLIYYRTGGHQATWTYRISDDNGKTWIAPKKDVTDFNINSKIAWCSYESCLPSKDGRYLHVAMIAFDDDSPTYNPRYNTEVHDLHCRYNLYYIKIDLQTDEVFNDKGEKLKTPIGFYQANEECLIWDTEWRATGVPPDITIDENGNPCFLHVLSEESLEHYNWHFVRLVNGRWEKTVIAPTNHQWNGGHIHFDEKKKIYHAYLIVGDPSDFNRDEYPWIETHGYMDRHGGGRIEEWISSDKGYTWEKLQDITPDPTKYSGWKFNNIQPVTTPYGSVVDGMFIYYGWKDKYKHDAKAFIMVDSM